MDIKTKQNLEKLLEIMPVYRITGNSIRNETADSIITTIEGKKTTKKTKPKLKI